MAPHPDLIAEQAYIDEAYACLDASRAAASRLTSMVEVGRGGTEQARFEREVIYDTVVNRLTQLQLGDAALCFGRIDRELDRDTASERGQHGGFAVPTLGDLDGPGIESFYIGRIAVSNSDQDPVIVD